MIWYVFCYTAYGDALRYGVINTEHLSFVQVDPKKRYDRRERHMVTSVKRARGSIHHYGSYMSMNEIVPVQFYPKPLSFGKFFGLEWDPKRLDPNLWELITCKTDKDPRKNYC